MTEYATTPKWQDGDYRLFDDGTSGYVKKNETNLWTCMTVAGTHHCGIVIDEAEDHLVLQLVGRARTIRDAERRNTYHVVDIRREAPIEVQRIYYQHIVWVSFEPTPAKFWWVSSLPFDDEDEGTEASLIQLHPGGAEVEREADTD